MLSFGPPHDPVHCCGVPEKAASTSSYGTLCQNRLDHPVEGFRGAGTLITAARTSRRRRRGSTPATLRRRRFGCLDAALKCCRGVSADEGKGGEGGRRGRAWRRGVGRCPVRAALNCFFRQLGVVSHTALVARRGQPTRKPRWASAQATHGAYICVLRVRAVGVCRGQEHPRGEYVQPAATMPSPLGTRRNRRTNEQV